MKRSICGLAMILVCALAGTAQAGVKIQTPATTNEKDKVIVTVIMDGGDKLAVVDWAVDLTIDGKVIDLDKCDKYYRDGGDKGIIDAPVNVSAGEFDVEITVKLSDGTKIKDKRKITFQKAIDD